VHALPIFPEQLRLQAAGYFCCWLLLLLLPLVFFTARHMCGIV